MVGSAVLRQKTQVVNVVRRLFPPDAVIGTGNGEVHQWRDWDVPLALLVDAASERTEWAYDWLKKHKDWQLANVLLADNIRQQDFFITSNKAESGVIAIEQLQRIWPDMQLKERQVLSTQRLQNLLESPSSQALREASCIWGIVDCLPALPVLKGAGDELKQWSVLWIRVVLDDTFSDNEQQSHSSLVAVTEFLNPLGYRCVEIIEENHPALGYALFIQD